KRAYCLKTQPATGETYPKSDLFNKAPVNYRNHFVTILGTIQGEQPGFINKVPYNFLEVNMQGIQVWHLREVVNTTYNLWDYGYGAFWPKPGWGAPYYTNAVSQVTPELVK
ncbi:Slp family lipoprotein, partial [Escherichia coli]